MNTPTNVPRPRLTVGDAVIRELADSEAGLLERVVDLTIERDSYRLLTQQLLTALYDLQDRERQQQDRYLRLLAEYRALREELLDREAAA